MTTEVYLVLALGALLGSTVSGITGVGGGMVYLPILVWGVGVKMAVPYLAILLLVGNISRAYFARSGIRWTVLKHIAYGAIPGAAIGALLYTMLPAGFIARALGVYLLLYVAMSFTRAEWPKNASLRSISVMGFPAGIVSAVVGGSGPIIAPWLLRYGLVKETFLGTEAVGAALMHVVKLSIWGGTGMIALNDVLILFPLGLLMIAGSYFGTKLVSRMRLRVFRAVLIMTLAIVGVRFILY